MNNKHWKPTHLKNVHEDDYEMENILKLSIFLSLPFNSKKMFAILLLTEFLKK